MYPSTTLSILALAGFSLATPQQTQVFTVPAPEPSQAPSYVDSNTFRDDVLNSTNFFRSEHNASDVKWNDTLANYAQNYVGKCIWKHSGGPLGENLAAGYDNVTAAIDGWGNERKDYNFQQGDFSEATGHFTQLVWKNTTSVGCGRKFCNGENEVNGWYLVCEYYPQGNVETEFTSNVQSQVKGKLPHLFSQLELQFDRLQAKISKRDDDCKCMVTYVPDNNVFGGLRIQEIRCDNCKFDQPQVQPQPQPAPPKPCYLHCAEADTASGLSNDLTIKFVAIGLMFTTAIAMGL